MGRLGEFPTREPHDVSHRPRRCTGHEGCSGPACLNAVANAERCDEDDAAKQDPEQPCGSRNDDQGECAQPGRKRRAERPAASDTDCVLERDERTEKAAHHERHMKGNELWCHRGEHEADSDERPSKPKKERDHSERKEGEPSSHGDRARPRASRPSRRIEERSHYASIPRRFLRPAREI